MSEKQLPEIGSVVTAVLTEVPVDPRKSPVFRVTDPLEFVGLVVFAHYIKDVVVGSTVKIKIDGYTKRETACFGLIEY